jgi:mycothiol synthase
MTPIHLRSVLPEKDFAEIALLLSSQEDEPTTEAAAREDYEQHKDSLVRLTVAEDEQGNLLGFTWAWCSKVEPGQVTFHLVVKPEHRRQGAGRRLYQNLARAARNKQAHKLRVNVRDTCPEGLRFVERRGFSELRHQIGMELDLASFDDRPYDEVLARLKGEGFRFTSMGELGNTEEAQHKLFTLNDTAAASTPGAEGEHPWASFKDFQQSVCGSDWYKPEGQIVAIDSLTGEWAGMSAITQIAGREYAYNLFTGVDLSYRGRKLGQAVKVLALRYARDTLKVTVVRTHHNTKNLPMLAIDRKFGYRPLPGSFLMEKELI